MSAGTRPAPTSPSTSVSFLGLLSLAYKTRGARSYHTNFEANRTALIRFADGAVCDEGERRDTERLIAQHDWALKFVADRIKQRRRKPNERNAA